MPTRWHASSEQYGWGADGRSPRRADRRAHVCWVAVTNDSGPTRHVLVEPVHSRRSISASTKQPLRASPPRRRSSSTSDSPGRNSLVSRWQGIGHGGHAEAVSGSLLARDAQNPVRSNYRLDPVPLEDHAQPLGVVVPEPRPVRERNRAAISVSGAGTAVSHSESDVPGATDHLKSSSPGPPATTGSHIPPLVARHAEPG
jgi:hypothetical protein